MLYFDIWYLLGYYWFLCMVWVINILRDVILCIIYGYECFICVFGVIKVWKGGSLGGGKGRENILF